MIWSNRSWPLDLLCRGRTQRGQETLTARLLIIISTTSGASLEQTILWCVEESQNVFAIIAGVFPSQQGLKHQGPSLKPCQTLISHPRLQ